MYQFFFVGCERNTGGPLYSRALSARVELCHCEVYDIHICFAGVSVRPVGEYNRKP